MTIGADISRINEQLHLQKALSERLKMSDFRPAAHQSADESYDMMGGHNNVLEDSYGNSSQDSTMMMREVTSFTGFIQTF